MDRTNPDVPSWGYSRTAKTSTFTVAASDRGITFDCTSGTFDAALTAAATLGAGFCFGVYNSGSGTVTINPSGAETIRSPAGSAATLALSQGQGVLVLCDGTGFEVVASTGIAPSPGSVISGLTTGRIVDAASATTVETALNISTDQNVVTTGEITAAVVNTPNVQATTSAGILLESNSGTDIALMGAGGGAGVTFYGGVILDAETASRVVTTDASKNLDTPATVTTGQAWAFTSTLTVVDGNLTITGSADATKSIKFEVDAQTANDTLTIDTGAQTDSRTATFPVLTGNSILTLSNATLTSGRIPFATTNGILTDSSTIQWDNATGRLTVLRIGQFGDASNTGVVQIAGAAGTTRLLQYLTGSTARWDYRANSTAESGANAGSDFQITAYTDAGGTIDSPLTITRASGGAFAVSRPITCASTTDSTSKDTGSIVTEGGIAGEKNFISAQGIHAGVSSTATAAGTTTLTSASRRTQIFTGTTTQTLQLPAANLFGAGIAVEYIVVNRSTGTVTAQRAGSDTFDGGGTTDAILTNTTRHYVSNGSNQWHTIA